ncbi:MAG: MerR family transcriptional regulator [Desulfamplus sp.]|nr:MerR family transcriptional regulator [Desulfamplus sp.]
MSAKDLMTPSMLAKELNTGSATVRFWLNRFSKWIPSISVNGDKLYDADTLKTLTFISDKINSGMVISEIEKALDSENRNNIEENLQSQFQPFISPFQSAMEDISSINSKNQELLLNNEGINLISTLFEKFYSQQERVAKAQERRAAAEELKAEAEQKKAQALEKRADAEIEKAHAMNNLADAIKSISANFLNSMPPAQQVQPHDPPDLSILIDEEKTDFEDEKDDEIDDLSALIDDEGYDTNEVEEIEENIDDLSALIDDENASFEDEKDDEIDDLSALIDEDSDYEQHDIKPDILDSDIDNLMSLIDDDVKNLDTEEKDDEIDDLSALIDEDEISAEEELTPNILDSDVDDLLSLIGDDNQTNQEDFLSTSGQTSSQTPKVDKPKASLEDNFEAYKSEVINIIIKLKEDGYSVDETTDILNNEDIKPLSGKNRWTTKMIAKIYNFIEAAKK